MAALARVKEPPQKISALGIVEPPPIFVESPTFTGSLATLFQVVRDRKIDLLDVPLLPICSSYLQYLIDNADTDLDSAAAALMALSFLIERKCWLLLPSAEPEPEEEEPFELPEPTSHEYRIAIEALKIFQEERDAFYFRPQETGPNPYEVPYEVGSISSLDLARALERLLKKAVPEPIKPLQKSRRSIADQMMVILRLLGPNFVSLDRILPEPFTREDAVYSFLAILELIRVGQVRFQVVGDDVKFANAAQLN